MKIRKSRRKKNWRRYGIKGYTYESYIQDLKDQDYRCLFCGKLLVEHKSKATIDSEPACVDHDHSTGKVRCLLCATCNRCIGLIKEDPKTLLRLLSILR